MTFALFALLFVFVLAVTLALRARREVRRARARLAPLESNAPREAIRAAIERRR
jgi:cbb3-type cytochrome oxidase subunit 3